MGRLEPIDGKCSTWEGLWWHPETNSFTSASLSLSDLRKYKGAVRLIVRKNKYYNGGENGRPNYKFCLRDVARDGKQWPVADIDEEGERLYTREEVETVKYGACLDGQRGFDPGDLLIEDYV